MTNCTQYPSLVVTNLAGIELKYIASLTDEEIEHLQNVAALKREKKLEDWGLSSSDLD